jgi:hypothetical protein
MTIAVFDRRDGEPAMRRLLRLFLAGCAILLGVMAPPSTQGQTVTAAQKAKVAAILVQCPDGGPCLSDAIAAAVEADPTLTFAVVAAALIATPEQQQAIGAGMAAAATFFAVAAAGSGPDADAARNAERLIQTAMTTAPTVALTAFAGAGGFTVLATTLGGGSASLTTSTCVSPSGPGASCR